MIMEYFNKQNYKTRFTNLSSLQQGVKFNNLQQKNIIITSELNDLIENINFCIDNLTYILDDQFCDLIEDPYIYINNVIDQRFPRVKYFNNQTGNVSLVSDEIEINRKKLSNTDLGNNRLDLYINDTNTPYCYVTSINEKGGHINSIATITINNKVYQYDEENCGVLFLGSDYISFPSNIAIPLTSVNGLNGNVKDLPYGISVNGREYKVDNNGYLDLSASIQDAFSYTFIPVSNPQFNTLKVQEIDLDNQNSVINKQFVDKNKELVIEATNEELDQTNNIIYTSLPTSEENFVSYLYGFQNETCKEIDNVEVLKLGNISEDGSVPLTFVNLGSQDCSVRLKCNSVTIPDDVDLYCNFYNNQGWIKYSVASSITLLPYHIVSFSGATELLSRGTQTFSFEFGLSEKIGAYGQVNSLINNGELTEGCFRNLFSGCTTLVNAPRLVNKTLAPSCYMNMFRGCTSLSAAPSLPAIIMTDYCYCGMFSGCTAMTAVPELPASTLAQYCYQYMFADCSNIVSTPQLPAIDLVDNCYEGMFSRCSKLSSVEVKFVAWNPTNATDNWLRGVASEGIFRKSTTLPVTNKIPAGWTVKTQPDPLTFKVLNGKLKFDVNKVGTYSNTTPNLKYKLNNSLEWKDVIAPDPNTGIVGSRVPTLSPGDVISLTGDIQNSLNGYYSFVFNYESNLNFSEATLDVFPNEILLSASYNTSITTLPAYTSALFNVDIKDITTTDCLDVPATSSKTRKILNNTFILVDGMQLSTKCTDLKATYYNNITDESICSAITQIKYLTLNDNILPKKASGFIEIPETVVSDINSINYGELLSSATSGQYIYVPNCTIETGTKQLTKYSALTNNSQLPLQHYTCNGYILEEEKTLFEKCEDKTVISKFSGRDDYIPSYTSSFIEVKTVITNENKKDVKATSLLSTNIISSFTLNKLYYQDGENYIPPYTSSTVVITDSISLPFRLVEEGRFEYIDSADVSHEILGTTQLRCTILSTYYYNPDNEIAPNTTGYILQKTEITRNLSTEIIKKDVVTFSAIVDDSTIPELSYTTELQTTFIPSAVTFIPVYGVKTFVIYKCGNYILTPGMNLIKTVQGEEIPFTYDLALSSLPAYTSAVVGGERISITEDEEVNITYFIDDEPVLSGEEINYSIGEFEIPPYTKSLDLVITDETHTGLIKDITYTCSGVTANPYILNEDMNLIRDLKYNEFGWDQDITILPPFTSGVVMVNDALTEVQITNNVTGIVTNIVIRDNVVTGRCNGYILTGDMLLYSSNISREFDSITDLTIPPYTSAFYNDILTQITSEEESQIKEVFSCDGKIIYKDIIFYPLEEMSVKEMKLYIEDNNYIILPPSTQISVISGSASNNLAPRVISSELPYVFLNEYEYRYKGALKSNLDFVKVEDNLYTFKWKANTSSCFVPSTYGYNPIPTNSILKELFPLTYDTTLSITNVWAYSIEGLLNTNISLFTKHGLVEVYGELSSLTNTLTDYNFFRLFYGNNEIVDASDLKLSYNTLKNNCYNGLFWGCSNLKYSPKNLPATILADECYRELFAACKSLQTTPLEFNAVTMKPGCYRDVFSACTALEVSPHVLPAMNLAPSCYMGMFTGCKKLTEVPELPAVNLEKYCYKWMFNDCITLKCGSYLPATELKEDCYGWLYSGCLSLVLAPQLMAEELVNGCYNAIFASCPSLSSITVNFKEWKDNCTNQWVLNAGSNGAFYKNKILFIERGKNFIPENWLCYNIGINNKNIKITFKQSLDIGNYTLFYLRKKK